MSQFETSCTFFFDSGILVKQFQNRGFKDAKHEAKLINRLAEHLTMKSKTPLSLPLAAAFEIYGQSYVCYSYPQIELSRIIMLRNNTYKLFRNETGKDVAQTLMSVARSKHVPYFSNKLA